MIFDKLSTNRPSILYLSLAVVLSLCFLSSCIENDLPYPRIQQNIIALQASGEIKPAEIDTENLLATVYVDEQADLAALSFPVFEVSEGASVSPNLAEGTHDLSSPLVVKLSLYQTYEWVVTAVQDIERYFTVQGQIGETVIDPVGHRILVKVPETMNLANVMVTSCKLGPAEISTMSPAMTPGRYDLSRPFHIYVTAHGREEEWTVYAEHTSLVVTTSHVDAWSQVIWAYGDGPADVKNNFRYRRADSDEWTVVPVEKVVQNQGAFSTCIDHLQPLTEYVIQAMSGDDLGDEQHVTTQATEVLTDGSFDQWWLDGRIWCPWDENGIQYWDTGNTGASTLGQSNVQPSDDTPTGSGKSAKLETRFVGIGAIGKLAAGSIYTGKFARVDGTNGILDFGRPFSLRPTKLRGYMKYTSEPINYTSAEFADLKGRPDTCHIYIALADWTAPFEIRTNPKNRQLFDPNSPSIIAYGELVQGSSDSNWKEFEIKLNYRSTSRIPTYIQITCAASKYGDYFTGGTGSLLFVDQFSLHYDY